MKIRSVASELYHADRHDKANSQSSQFCAWPHHEGIQGEQGYSSTSAKYESAWSPHTAMTALTPPRPPEKYYGTNYSAGWAGLRTGLDVSETRQIPFHCRYSNPGLSRHYSSLTTDYKIPAIQVASLNKLQVKGKGKAVPLQAWTGPEGSRKLRFPDFVTTHDGGRLSALRTDRFTPRKYSWYSFLSEAASTPGP